jgi:hypothetical protein
MGGFNVVAHHTAAEMEKKYLTADDGTFFGQINGTHAITAATVKDGRIPSKKSLT